MRNFQALIPYYTNDFNGAWPVGTAAVCTATNAAHARRKFLALFKKAGVPQGRHKWTVHMVNSGPATMLQDGEY